VESWPENVFDLPATPQRSAAARWHSGKGGSGGVPYRGTHGLGADAANPAATLIFNRTREAGLFQSMIAMSGDLARQPDCPIRCPGRTAVAESIIAGAPDAGAAKVEN